MIKVKFNHTLYGEELKVFASAKDVDAYGAIGLKFRFTDRQGDPVEVYLDKTTMEELTEMAGELLYERKYTKELEF
jgi:hypothetical protein